MITGKATPQGTQLIKDAHTHLTYNTLSDSQLYISQAGFGTYRLTDDLSHKEALKEALTHGINLIDTSSNYTDGQSEISIGEVLKELIEAKLLSREQVVIISKGGYLQGEHLASYKKHPHTFSEVITFSDYLSHCIHPTCLDKQLQTSLDRLDIESIDIYLLHNPEYYLEWAATKKIPLEEARKTFYKRIKHAFEWAEKQVQEGYIQYYGVSSNTCVKPANDTTYVNTETLVNLAKEISEKNHFKVIQCPLNILEHQAVTLENNVCHIASKNGLSLITNRPLNAIQNQQLYRLTDYVDDIGVSVLEIEDITATIQELLHNQPQLAEIEEKEKEAIQQHFKLSTELIDSWQQFTQLEQWKENIFPFIVYQTESIINFAAQLNLSSESHEWLTVYFASINQLVDFITKYLKQETQNRNQYIKTILCNTNTLFGQQYTLSQNAIRALRHTPNIDAILVGMRHSDYVRDVLVELQSKNNTQLNDESWKKIEQALKKV